MLNYFFRKRDTDKLPLLGDASSLMVDVHSHVLPGLDDGAENIEQSVALISGLADLGYKKIIATPHIMSGYYNNTNEQILQSLELVRNALKNAHINIQIEAAAEYYLDNELLSAIENQKTLLTFGGNARYLLFETPLVGRSTSSLLESVIKIKKAGYTPVMAHPERYLYLYKEIEMLKRLRLNGVLFQLDINSISNFYSKLAKESAELLINQGMISFLGSNCHNINQLEGLKISRQKPHYQIVSKQNILNNYLLETPSLVVSK